MSLIRLAWKNILSKPWSTLLSLILFALGTGLIAVLLLMQRQIQENFERNLAGIDLVIGAKGSPLQLILSSMYHIDAPTGNIPLKEVKPFLNPKHPLIGSAVPLSLGDSYRGYRIVGTTHDFLTLYGATIAEGRLWEAHMETTIGAEVARATGLKIGDIFRSSHGFEEDVDAGHVDHLSFEVVGILAAGGTVADQLILTTNQSFWYVHGEASHEHAEDSPGTEPQMSADTVHTQTDGSGEGHQNVRDPHASDHHAHDEHEHSGQVHEEHDHQDHAHADSSGTQAGEAQSHEHDDHSHDGHAHDEHEHSGQLHEEHDHEDHAHADHGHDHSVPLPDLKPLLEESEDLDITSLLITFKATNYQALNMQRSINENTDMQAATPAIEINRLFSLMSSGERILRLLAWIITIVSGLSVFISLFSSLRERRYELALMRVMGGGRTTLFVLIILEGLLMAGIGCVIGLLLSHGAMELLGGMMEEEYRYRFTGLRFLREEIWLVAGALIVGFIAALIPAIQASKTDIATTLTGN